MADMNVEGVDTIAHASRAIAGAGAGMNNLHDSDASDWGGIELGSMVPSPNIQS